MDYLLIALIAVFTVLTLWVLISTPSSTKPEVSTPEEPTLEDVIEALQSGLPSYMAETLEGLDDIRVPPEEVGTFELSSLHCDKYEIDPDIRYKHGDYIVNGVLHYSGSNLKVKLDRHEPMAADALKVESYLTLTLAVQDGVFMVKRAQLGLVSMTPYINDSPIPDEEDFFKTSPIVRHVTTWIMFDTIEQEYEYSSNTDIRI